MAVITEPFVHAAGLMAEICGVPGYRFAVVGHPFSSNGPEGVRRKARDAAAQAVELLLRR